MKRTVKETTKEYDTEGRLVREIITETTEEGNDSIIYPSYPTSPTYPINPSWPTTTPTWPNITWTTNSSEVPSCPKESLS